MKVTMLLDLMRIRPPTFLEVLKLELSLRNYKALTMPESLDGVSCILRL